MFPNMMKTKSIIIKVAEIIYLCATTADKRKCIQEQSNVIFIIIEALEKPLCFEVIE